MIAAMTQTLASLLAQETSLTGTEQIDFDHPAICRPVRPRLSLYCYDFRQNFAGHPSWQQQVYHLAQQQMFPQHPSGLPQRGADAEIESKWFDISFIVSAWDWTEFGEKQLLSEALLLLLRHRLLPSDRLAPALQGMGTVYVTVSRVPLGEVTALWRALEAPLRPAIYVTVTLPFSPPTQVPTLDQASLTPAR